MQDLPKAYGGELDWSFLDEPKLDDDAKKVLSEGEESKGMPRGPAIFDAGEAHRPEVKPKESSVSAKLE